MRERGGRVKREQTKIFSSCMNLLSDHVLLSWAGENTLTQIPPNSCSQGKKKLFCSNKAFRWNKNVKDVMQQIGTDLGMSGSLVR